MRTLKMFAIRQKSTGNYLPNTKKRFGGTHMEPEPPSEDNPPRLFKNAGAAKKALNFWLRGEITATTVDTFGGQDMQAWKIRGRANRKESDMEIVEVFVILEPKEVNWD